MSTRRTALAASAVLLVLGSAGVLSTAGADPRRALLGWIAAFGFGLGTSLGALILAMVLQVTNARWPVVVRPAVMAIASTTPLFALLFVPIALGMRLAYPWAHPGADVVAGAHASAVSLAHQRLWQTPAFFLARAALCLATWSALSLALGRADARHDRAPTEATACARRRISAAGLPILALTMTFASFDWFMAVDPGWVSDMYGLYFFSGGLASAVALVAIVAWAGARTGHDATATLPGPSHFHAIGRLMLMGTILWAYIAFFQFLLVWIANLPREVGFYAVRAENGYQVVDYVLVFGRFVVPFLVLLSRELKFKPAALAAVALWLVLMDAVDFAWLVLPRAGGGPRVLDSAPFLVVSALAVGLGVLRSGTRYGPSHPSDRDPWLAESMRYTSP